MYRIAIQPDNQRLTSGKYQSFSTRWVELARQAGHEPVLVDVYKPDLMERLRACDGFMWWFAHLPYPRNYGKRLLPAISHGIGIPVFPNWQTVWHFDDKIAQTYLLQAAGIPMPKTWVFWTAREALEFCRAAQYPLVIKLTSGIVSENVRLLHDAAEAEYWIRQLFGLGIVSLERPNVFSPAEVYRRLRGAAKVVIKGTPPAAGLWSLRTDVQKGYLLLQEFVPNNHFDTRIAIIGNRAFGFRRLNRPNDFRASGSGLREHDPAKIDPAGVRLAFQAARHLGTQSLAIDVLFQEGRPVLTEISYYYEGWLLAEFPGHWRLAGDDPATAELEWVEGHVLPEDAIFQDFLPLIDAHKRRAPGSNAQSGDPPGFLPSAGDMGGNGPIPAGTAAVRR